MRFLLLATLTALTATVCSAQIERTRDNMRNNRYGEVLVVTGGPFSYVVHVYNTIGLNECPEAEWKTLDPAKLKKQFKARAVLLNGPRYFLMDKNTIANPGPVATFGGLQARELAQIDISLPTLLRGKAKPYEENQIKRKTAYVFEKGKPTYQLTSADGKTYVMQTYAQIVDPKLTMADLATLGKRLKLPKGWQYKVVTPKEDLVLRANGTAYVLQDNLENTYQRAD